MKKLDKKKLNSVLIAAFLIVCAVLYVLIYVVPSITGALTETAVLEYGRLQTVLDEKCLIVRDEMLVMSNDSGEVTRYIDETAKTKVGSKVLDVYPPGGSAKSYLCPSTGFVSFYCDGYESLGSEGIENISVDILGDEEYELREIPLSVSSGEPLYKLIKSDNWYIVAIIGPEELGKFEIGKSVTALIDDVEIPGSISEVIDRTDYYLVVVSTKRFHPEFAKYRLKTISLVTEDKEGLIVPNTAITEVDGKVGVYVKNVNDEYVFTRVQVIVEGATESLLTADTFTEKDENGETKTISTVEIYDEVKRNAN